MVMFLSSQFWLCISLNLYFVRDIYCSEGETDFDSISRCSLFNFEQKLLEKLVRMEVKVEAMEREITTFRHSSQVEMGRVNADLLRLGNLVDKKVVPVVFEASGLTKDTNLKNEIIKFDKRVGINTGEGYNKETGIFKAPSAGTYVFELQLCIESKKRVLVAITVNNSPIKMIDYNNTGSGYTCISGSGLSEMGSESEAFVRCKSETDDGDVLHNQEKYTSFSGRKLL